MKITIDTSHDSHDEIKKVINVLANIVGESGSTTVNNEEVETVEPQPINDSMFGMFNNEPTEEAPAAQIEPEETLEQVQPEPAEQPAVANTDPNYTVEGASVPVRDMPEVVADDDDAKIVPY